MAHSDRYGNDLATPSERAARAYIQGVDLFLAGTFGAVAQFETAVAEDAGFALGHVGLARARMMGGDMAGAQAALSQAVSLKTEQSSQIQSK